MDIIIIGGVVLLIASGLAIILYGSYQLYLIRTIDSHKSKVTKLDHDKASADLDFDYE